MRVLRNSDFTWRGLSLCLGRSKRPLLELVPDERKPDLYRIRYASSGWTSCTAVSLTRARDAAYGHARHLLGGQTALELRHSPEEARPAADATPTDISHAVEVA